MKANKAIGTVVLLCAAGCFIAYFILSYFLPYSLEEISRILTVLTIFLILSLLFYFSNRSVLQFTKFETEITVFLTALALFYLISALYNQKTLGAIFSLKTRRLGFIIIDLLYTVLASLLFYLFITYFIAKFSTIQKSIFYSIVFLFFFSLEIPIIGWLFYLLIFILFIRNPWLIAVSHNFRKYLLIMLIAFWLIYIISPLPFAESFELFPNSPRLMIGTASQLRLNASVLIFLAAFSLSLFFSLIKTSRTIRSKNVLIYFLTSFIPIAAIIILFVLSYINISIFFKSYLLEDKFIYKIRRYNDQFIKQQGFINIIKYASSPGVVEERVAFDRLGDILKTEVGEKPLLKLQYIKKGKSYYITTKDYPASLNPADDLPIWYTTAEPLPVEMGIKGLLNRIFSRNIENSDRLFIRTEDEVFFMSISTYEDKDISLKLALFLPINSKVTKKLFRDHDILFNESDGPAESESNLLTSAFHIRDFENGEASGSARFVFFKSLSDLLYGRITGTDTLTRFVGGLRDLIFSFLLLFILIIGLLSFAAMRVNRGLRLSLQKIILGMRRIGEGNLDYKIDLTSRDEYFRLASSINEMMSDIKTYMEDRVEKEKLKGEVHTAYNIQRSILPESDPIVKGLEISSYVKPAEEVGGDYYDFILINKKRLGLVIGDVSGHGIPAGLLMAMAKSCLYNQAQHSTNVIRLMEAMNKMVFDTVQQRLLMTFLYAVIDTSRNKLSFSNAGHHYPYILKHNGKLLSLEYPSYPLGVRRNSKFKMLSYDLEKGDIMIFYSDGIIEQTNKKMELFGFTRYEEAIKSKTGASAKEVMNHILNRLDDFAEGTDRVDDVTLIVIKFDL